MATNKQIKYWRIAASASSKPISRPFPMFNDTEAMPVSDIDGYTQQSFEGNYDSQNIPRCDYLQYIRTFKVVGHFFLQVAICSWSPSNDFVDCCHLRT